MELYLLEDLLESIAVEGIDAGSVVKKYEELNSIIALRERVRHRGARLTTVTEERQRA